MKTKTLGDVWSKLCEIHALLETLAARVTDLEETHEAALWHDRHEAHKAEVRASGRDCKCSDCDRYG